MLDNLKVIFTQDATSLQNAHYLMTKTIKTRFAPSPTGFLHIGGARTALFNWLYAQNQQGEYLLRIEDTDRERSTDGAIDAILDGLDWLGLKWDGDPVFQHQGAKRHQEIAGQLLESGHAYKCFCTAEELQEMRDTARANKQPPRYDGRWRDKSAADHPTDADFVIRFKTPKDGQTIIGDKVQGKVTFANKELDDLILLRSDGSPTYMLSVVVDDHDMGISHIIRGDDHLTNAARQTQIYNALGWKIPTFAHIPLIHGADGAKLSKRHGALGVEAYRSMGYLPEALRNYLVRLGWSHGNDEIFDTDQMVKWFSLKSIGKSPARFDFKKLKNLNGHYIKTCDDATLSQHLRRALPDFIDEDGNRVLEDMPGLMSEENWQKLSLALPGLKERAKTLVELMDNARFLFVARPLAMAEKAGKHLTDESRGYLGELLERLSHIEDWSMDTLETEVKKFTDDKELKLGKIAQPLRAALTGTPTSPGIYDVLYALGKEESLARIQDQLS